MLNYKEDLHIDVHQLDVEWLAQPQLFAEYAELLADAKAEFDKIKEELDLVRAELDADIRENPDVYGLKGRLTETIVQSCIIMQPKYKRALKRFHTAKHNVEVLKVAVQAFEQRKSALENLVKLFGMQYYSTPTEPQDLDSVSQKYFEKLRKSKVREKINTKLNSKEE